MERGVLSCLMLLDKAAPLLELAAQLRPADFYDLRHRELFAAIVDTAKTAGAFDILLLRGALKKAKKPELYEFAIQEVMNAAPSPWNFPYYLEDLRSMTARRRLLDLSTRAAQFAHDDTQDPHALIDEFASIAPAAGGFEKAPTLKIWRASELQKYEPPEHLQLVGDNELVMGYEGVVVLAGPGSSGKSLAVDALALAGAKGSGDWMGRKVHRKFKTMIIQAENGTRRLKRVIEEMKKNHPKTNIEESIFLSSPPEGGIPFHRAEFRAAVKRAIDEFKPDIVVLDPWSQVATEDAAKEVVDKLGEIRSCFPAGDNCPCLLIVAHTKKPRPEDVRKGRGLTYLVSGSVALPNTARCVYVLLPWNDDMEDDRIYWACPKLNDGVMYGASVWHRRLGTFFEADKETDPKTWGKGEEREETRAISEEDLREAFGEQEFLDTSVLVARLVKRSDCSRATVYRAITRGPLGYLADLLEKDKSNPKWVRLKSR